MKKGTLLLLSAALALVVMVGVACVEGTGGIATSIPDVNIRGLAGGQQTGIWVTGEGKVTAAPDTAVISLGIEAQAKTVTEAQRQASSAMDAVMAALKAKGVKEKDIQTRRFSIQPVIRFIDKENRQEIIGYRVSNVVVAKVRKVDDAGPVIDAVAEAGGDLTRIEGISFTIDDPTALQAQALNLALADAKAKAKAMAAGLDVRLGKLTFSQAFGAPQPVPVQIPVLSREAGALATTPISPGELTIQATVTAAFDID
ncbi:MAG: SIMPL domain-containing protein [Chloroflexi bacterium]|nr:SIMPL domain-containing protein [Chloroflexota bacterium]